jgi:hypothetical protein
MRANCWCERATRSGGDDVFAVVSLYIHFIIFVVYCTCQWLALVYKYDSFYGELICCHGYVVALS